MFNCTIDHSCAVLPLCGCSLNVTSMQTPWTKQPVSGQQPSANS